MKRRRFYLVRNFRYAVALLMLTIMYSTIYAQSGIVEGIVLDETDAPFVGVSVLQKGTKNSTATNTQGRYSIRVDDTHNAVLQVSFIGYSTREEPVKSRSRIDLKLSPSSQTLDEVVAIGYGTVKKRDLTGAVSSVHASELLKTNPVSINQSLQGKVAGLVVSQADGAPGAGISIQIRGANSFSTSTEPLYVIDGVPFNAGSAPGTDYATKQTNNPLNIINPRDVASIEILKDASATAIYGSRAANGVVIITTKSGSQGKTKVELSINTNLANAVKLMPVLDAATYAEYRNEQTRNGYIYDGKEFFDEADLPFPIPGRYSYVTAIDPITNMAVNIDSTYLPSPEDFRRGYMGGGTNWQNEIFHTAFSKDYNLGISGGDSKGNYMFSLAHLDQQGIIINSFFKRYSIRSNVKREVNEWFEFGNNLTASKSQNRLARTNSETFGVIPSALSFNPTRSIFDPDQPSGVTEDSSNGLSNPYLYVRTAKDLLASINIYNSTYGEIKLFDFLKFRQNLGYGYSQGKRNIYNNRYISGGVAPINGAATQSDNYYESVTAESMLQFNKSFNNIHRIDGVVGWTYENVFWGGKSMSGSGFANDITEENDMGSALIQNPNFSSKGKSSLMSFLGRLNYIFMDKYLLTGTFRRDGSSRLSPQGRWNNFSSAAFAWRASDETFIQNIGVFDMLKFRLSYGETGNQGINAYATRSRMTVQQYPNDDALVNGYAEDRWGGPASPNLKWETTKQYNAGVDIGILDNRVNFVVDVYRKRTTDLLQYAFIPLSTGFSTIATNYGNVENSGIEITTNTSLINKSKFSWAMNANIAFNRNKISGLDADQFSDVVWGLESVFLRRNDHAIGTLYTYQEDGYYDTEAEVRASLLYKNESDDKVRSMIGQVKYKDLNEDGMVDDRDKSILGSTNPDFTYGMTHNFTYDNFSFSFFFQGVQGNDILNANLRSFDMAGTINMPQFVWDNRWTEESKKDAQFPRADNTYTRSLKASNRLIENGSYLRLKNISMGYRFDKLLDEMETVNLTFSVNNLFTITKYSWFDPDVNAFGGDASRRGVDMASYPTARTYHLGVQIAF